jgi:hypothetical protein
MNPWRAPGWIFSRSGRSNPEAPWGVVFFQVLSDAENASANKAESQPTTVSGVTITSAFFHFDHVPLIITQDRRSK